MKKTMQKLSENSIREFLLSSFMTFEEEEITDFEGENLVEFRVKMMNFNFKIYHTGDKFVIHTGCNRIIKFLIASDVIDYLTLMDRVDKLLKYGDVENSK